MQDALSEVLARLTDPDPRVRALAADEASDHLRGRFVDQPTAEAAVAGLIAATAAATEHSVQEAALNACSDAAVTYQLPLTLFAPLIPLLPTLPTEPLIHALSILGATHTPAARPLIAPRTTHPDPSVRAEAATALQELAENPS